MGLLRIFGLEMLLDNCLSLGGQHLLKQNMANKALLDCKDFLGISIWRDTILINCIIQILSTAPGDELLVPHVLAALILQGGEADASRLVPFLKFSKATLVIELVPLDAGIAGRAAVVLGGAPPEATQAGSMRKVLKSASVT